MAQRVTLALPDPANPGQDINVGTAISPLVISGGGGTQANPGIAGGEYNSTFPTLTNGQIDALQLDSRANLRVTLVASDSNSGVSTQSLSSDAVTSAASSLRVSANGFVFNGSNWDRARGDTVSMFSRNAPRTKNSSALTAAGTTSQQAFAANSVRTRLLIQNQDAAINIFVNLGAAATAGGGSLRIGPGGSLDLTGTSETVNIIAASGTPAITAWEF